MLYKVVDFYKYRFLNDELCILNDICIFGIQF